MVLAFQYCEKSNCKEHFPIKHLFRQQQNIGLGVSGQKSKAETRQIKKYFAINFDSESPRRKFSKFYPFQGDQKTQTEF